MSAAGVESEAALGSLQGVLPALLPNPNQMSKSLVQQHRPRQQSQHALLRAGASKHKQIRQRRDKTTFN